MADSSVSENGSAGELRLTPSARAILAYVADHEGEPVTKAAIASALGRSEKTVDRLMSKMREHNYLEVETRWSESGAQLANSYKVVSR